MIEDALAGKIDLIITRVGQQVCKKHRRQPCDSEKLREKGVESILRKGEYLYIRQQRENA